MAKEELWRGLTKEEAKKLDDAAFMGHLNSRQRRSLRRGLSEEKKAFLEKVKGKDNVKTHLRDMIIMPSMLDKTIKVYNGKEFVSVRIGLEMLGHYLGEFALTRKSIKHSAPGVGATKSSSALSVR